MTRKRFRLMSTMKLLATQSLAVESLMFVRDTKTPSGVRLKSPAGSLELKLRYYTARPRLTGPWLATSFLDLLIQTTDGLASVRGREVLLDKLAILQASVLSSLCGLSRMTPLEVVEKELKVKIIQE